MKFNFRSLKFEETDGALTLFGFPFVEINIAGRNKPYTFCAVGGKLISSSEGTRLVYSSHRLEQNSLVVVQENDLIRVTTSFIGYDDTNAISVQTAVENISEKSLTLENVSSLVLNLDCPVQDTDNMFLYKFTQGHHGECQPYRTSIYDLGLTPVVSTAQKRVGGMNVGSWSTKEELPQGILERDGKFLMFQIESNSSWYYEIGDFQKKLYLYLGGGTESFGSWTKTLKSGQSYQTKTIALSFGESLDQVVGEMTKYRRHISAKCSADKDLPTIFNEYMHLSWDSPSEEKVKLYAPIVKKTGVKYYVIDCGWHDDEKGYIYPFVGKWKQSNTRFPSGVKATTQYLNSLGLKAGLWIEPEVVGVNCKEMIDYYGEECFLHRHGERIQVLDRYFLDFRKKKVVDYLTETIKRMVTEYGAEYIKLDYNQDMGVGVDGKDGFGAQLEECANAYLEWIAKVRKLFPNVVFETCASGGMRMDYQTLRSFTIASTSDQTNYKKYPYIASNVLSAVLPEQSAVWSYPVGTFGEFKTPFTATTEWVEENISAEQVVMNMINAFLGRLHLASHLELLSKEKLELVREGVEYYDKLTEIKKLALPTFPLGFKRINDKLVACGLKAEDKLYLAVWNLSGDKKAKIPVAGYNSAVCAYPKNNKLKFRVKKGELTVKFDKDCQARFFELY